MVRSRTRYPLLRQLLLLDKPLPEQTAEELVAERDANYRWNYSVNLVDGAAFWVGQSFITSATIVPL